MSGDASEGALLLHRVRDLVARQRVTCAVATAVSDVARRMTDERVGSVVVLDADGTPTGIVTDRDLRRKVVAAGRDPRTTPASAIMSTPLVTTPPTALALDALLQMTRHEIHHLVVVDGGRLLGVVSSHDLFGLQAEDPVVIGRGIGSAASVGALAALADRTTRLVRRLVEAGAAALDVAQLVAELNDRVIAKVLDLIGQALRDAGGGVPPVPYCWLLFGSEARREQTLRTDQDNGLVYADPPDALRAAVESYYARFTTEAIRALVDVGFPRCPGDVMASNPRWCQPLSAWADQFRRWIDHPSPQEVLEASIFFDLRPVTGAAGLAEALRDVVRREAPKSRVFLGLLAHDVVSRRVPLTIFGNIATLGSGAHRGRVDVKGAGCLQLVGAARVGALELGLAETNTVDRIRAATAHGVYTPEEATEIGDAYQHLLRLRLVHQLSRLADGAEPDNYVDPARLSHADALLFRDALKTVGRVQAGLRARFSTDRLG